MYMYRKLKFMTLSSLSATAALRFSMTIIGRMPPSFLNGYKTNMMSISALDTNSIDKLS